MEFAGRLVSTRRGTLLVAALIALLAGASILVYLNSYRESLKSQGALVTVLVAKGTIHKGTAGSVVAEVDPRAHQRFSGCNHRLARRAGSVTPALRGFWMQKPPTPEAVARHCS